VKGGGGEGRGNLFLQLDHELWVVDQAVHCPRQHGSGGLVPRYQQRHQVIPQLLTGHLGTSTSLESPSRPADWTPRSTPHASLEVIPQLLTGHLDQHLIQVSIRAVFGQSGCAFQWL